jgi:regulatory protein YycI of two-component signal transduction system YycFG
MGGPNMDRERNQKIANYEQSIKDKTQAEKNRSELTASLRASIEKTYKPKNK